MSMYRSAGPYLYELSAVVAESPIYQGRTAVIDVTFTLAGDINQTIGKSNLNKICVILTIV